MTDEVATKSRDYYLGYEQCRQDMLTAIAKVKGEIRLSQYTLGGDMAHATLAVVKDFVSSFYTGSTGLCDLDDKAH